MTKKYKVYDRDSFIKAAEEKYGDRFNYDKVVYKKQQEKVIIECKEHGERLQTPEKHLTSKFGCPECALLMKRKPIKTNKMTKEFVKTDKREEYYKKKRLSKEEYLNRLYKKHGDKYTYDLSNYIALLEGEVELNCTLHGKSTYNPKSLLQSGHGCRDCGIEYAVKSKTLSYDDLLKEFQDKYGDKYIYLEENRETYLNKRSKIKFYCEEHDEISIKTARKHLSGQYCYLCKLDEGIKDGKYPGGYTYDLFKRNKNLKNKKGVIYYVKVGDLYKVGITMNFKNRLRALKSDSKENVKVIYTIEDSLYNCYKLEQYILEKYRNDRISKFWSTELFCKDILVNSSLSDENLIYSQLEASCIKSSNKGKINT